MSSRNALPRSRERARDHCPPLCASLRAAERHRRRRADRGGPKRREIETILLDRGRADIEYIAVVDPDTLEPRSAADGPTLIALAVEDRPDAPDRQLPLNATIA